MALSPLIQDRQEQSAERLHAQDTMRRLNASDALPPAAFRRNHAIYELVAYVNNLLGCRLAANVEGQGIFKDRIERYMAAHAPKPDEAAYYQLVSRFLAEPD